MPVATKEINFIHLCTFLLTLIPIMKCVTIKWGAWETLQVRIIFTNSANLQILSLLSLYFHIRWPLKFHWQLIIVPRQSTYYWSWSLFPLTLCSVNGEQLLCFFVVLYRMKALKICQLFNSSTHNYQYNRFCSTLSFLGLKERESILGYKNIKLWIKIYNTIPGIWAA